MLTLDRKGTFTADVVIVATPAHAAAKLTENIVPELHRHLTSVYYPPVAEVFLGFRENQIGRPLDGFGFLVPAKEHRRILGTIWSSTLFPRRAPEGYVALTTFVGGSRQPGLLSANDKSLVQIVTEELQELMQAGGAQMIKLEGARIEIVRFLVEQGIPVCGHLGLLPQSINQLGHYKVQGRDRAEADRILADAHRLEQAGAGLLVLECVPSALAKDISTQLSIPVIGIGAGLACDGQVLVLYDMLNIGLGKRPRFSRDFMRGAASLQEACIAYHQAVKLSQFPAAEHSY